MPGVKAVIAIAKAGTTLRYHGDDIAAVAAETEEQARDAVARDQGRVRGPAPRRHRGAGDGRRRPRGRPRRQRPQGPRNHRRASPRRRCRQAAATIEATYSLPVITHVCLETHGLTAKWDGDDKIVAWASTQAVGATASELRRAFDDPGGQRHGPHRGHGGRVRLEVRRRHLGPDRGRAVARRPAAGRSRCSSTGSRSTWRRATAPAPPARVKLGADKDGKLVAMIAETHGTGGSRRRLAVPAALRLRRPDRLADSRRRSSSTRAAPRHAGPGPSPGLRHHGSGHGRPGRQARDRPARVPAQEPAADAGLPDADLRGRGQDGGRADRLAREPQAARPERQGADQARARAWRCTSGAAAARRTSRSPARSTPTARSS